MYFDALEIKKQEGNKPESGQDAIYAKELIFTDELVDGITIEYTSYGSYGGSKGVIDVGTCYPLKWSKQEGLKK